MSHYKYFTPKAREKILLLYEKIANHINPNMKLFFLKNKLKPEPTELRMAHSDLASVPVFCNPVNQNISPQFLNIPIKKILQKSIDFLG